MQTKKKTYELTELERLKVKLAHAHNYYYWKLIKYGPNLFEDDGNIILRKKDGTRNQHPGRKLILDTIEYFESRDVSEFYMKCARLKRVLDDYDKRFKIEKTSDQIGHYPNSRITSVP